MGTAGAHDRRTGRNGVRNGVSAFLFLPEGFRDQILGEFIDQGQDLLAGDRNAQGADMILDDGIQFFHDVQFIHFCRETADQVHGEGIGHTQLQDADSIAKDFFYILIGGGGGNNTDLCAAHLDPVQGGGLGIGGQQTGPLLNDGMTPFGIAGHHDVLADILFIGTVRYGPFSNRGQRLGMRDPGAHFQQDGCVELL